MNPTDTLSGAYGAARLVLPDGQEVPVLARRVTRGDGTTDWLIIDDKAIEFEARFTGTSTQPHDFLAPDTEVLDRKPSRAETTQRVLCGDLVMFLGDPQRILAQKGLDPDRAAHMKQHPASLTMARRLCQVAGGEWLQALQYLPQAYPDRAAGAQHG